MSLSELLEQLSFSLPQLAGLLVVVVLAVKYYQYAKGKVHLPGPLPLPIVGNLTMLGQVSVIATRSSVGEGSR